MKCMMKMTLLLLINGIPAVAQCGNTLNWLDTSCQAISSSQQLTTAIVNGVNDPIAWTVISRHGEYTQNETECNVPTAISVANSAVTINTTQSAYICGDFIATPGATQGNIRTAPTSWPWSTGDLQWNTFNFQYGTVLINAKLPPKTDSLWPAFWLLTSGCQTSNKYTGDTSGSGTDPSCPNYGTSGYTEIDIDEWNPPQFHVANPGFSLGGGCDWTSPTELDQNYHLWQMNWTPSAITLSIDGSLKTTCNTAISGNMFYIQQIQTSNSCANTSWCSPGSMVVDFVKICSSSYTPAQCQNAPTNGSDSYVIFYDDFNPLPASSGIVLILG